MRLFANPERALSKKLDRALAASERDDFAEAARLYGEVANDASALRGPEDPVALTAREDVAAAYLQLGELERGRALLLELIPEMERAPALGPDSRHTVNARVALAASYGEEGDHEKALELLTLEAERAEQVLGPGDETTFEVRENLATAARALAEPELERILALSPESDGEPVDRSVWETHLPRAAEAIRSCESYRSKRLMNFRAEDEEGSIEWLIEVAPEDRLRVDQTIHSPSEGDLYDLWVVIKGYRYRNAGVWLDESGQPEEQQAGDAQVDEAMKLGSYLSFFERELVQARVHDVSGQRYLRLEYAAVPPWLAEDLPDDEALTERTDLWLRWDTDNLERAEVSATSETSGFKMEIKQAFSSIGPPIVVSAPPSPVVPGRYEEE